MSFLKDIFKSIAGPIVGGLFGLANNDKNQPVAMSDYDWDKYQRQLDRANPKEIARQTQFLEGLAEPQAAFDSAQITGTLDAEDQRMNTLGQTGINLEEQAARQVGQANIDVEKDRVNQLGEFGLNPWELLGANQSINQVTAPNIPGSPSKAAPPQAGNPAMLSQLINSATSMENTKTQANAQIMSAALASGASLGSSNISAKAQTDSAQIAADVGFDRNEVERLKARLQEQDIVSRARRMAEQTEIENKRLLVDQFKAYAAELPKQKLKTWFGEITGHQSDEANSLMKWAAANFHRESMPSWFGELSNKKVQEMVSRNMVWVDMQNTVGGSLHEGATQIANFFSNAKKNLNFLPGLVPSN